MSINTKQSLTGNLNVGSGPEVKVYSYYTPNVTQPDDNTIQVEYTPSSEAMPALNPVQITIPAGPKGENGKDGEDGKDGTDGRTPYIGDNGNWFIGDEDTGVRAGGSQSSDEDQLTTLIEADMLPAVHENGAILTDQNGNIILRY